MRMAFVRPILPHVQIRTSKISSKVGLTYGERRTFMPMKATDAPRISISAAAWLKPSARSL